MDSFGTVRALAREKHALVRAKASGDAAVQLLAAARAETGPKLQKLAPDHPLLGDGDGALRRSSNAKQSFLLPEEEIPTVRKLPNAAIA